MGEPVGSGGMDFQSMMMAMMPVLLQALAAGQHGMGSSQYVPRMSMPGMGSGAGGFLGNLAGSGESGQMMAMVASMMNGVPGMPDISRLQMSQFGNPYLQREQLMLQQSVARYSMGMTGNDMVRSMGMDPTSAAGKVLSPMMPMMMQMMPELRGIALAASPTATFDAGRTLATTAQMMDPMGRLDQGRFNALGKAFDDFTVGEKDGRRYRRATNMAGFTRDDFATFVQLGADLGLVDTDFSQEERKRMRDDGKSQTEIDSEERMRVGRNQASIGRAMRNSIAPGASAGQLAQLQQEMGLVGNSPGESAAIAKFLNELEGLSRAAGMTAQEMMNAGRSLQQQNGGSLVYNMEAAAQGKLIERFMRSDGAKDGGTVAGLPEYRSAEYAGAQSSYLQAGYVKTMTGIKRMGTEDDRAELFEGAREAAAGDPTRLIAQLKRVQQATSGNDRAMETYGVTRSDVETQAFWNDFTIEAKEKGIDASRMFPALLGEQSRRTLAGGNFLKVLDKLSKSDRDAYINSYQGSGRDPGIVIEGFKNLTDEEKTELRMGGDTEAERQLIMIMNAQDATARSDAAVKEHGKRLGFGDEYADALQEMHGKGLFTNIRDLIRTGNFDEAATGAGLAVPKEIVDAFKEMDEADQAAFERAEKVIHSKDSTPEQILKANEVLMSGDAGITDRIAGRFDAAAKGPAQVAIDQAAPAGKVGPASSTGSKGPEEVHLTITLKDQNGQEMPATVAGVAAGIVTGLRTWIVNGVGPAGAGGAR